MAVHLQQSQNWDSGAFHVHTQCYGTIDQPQSGVTANTQMWTDLLFEGFHATVTIELMQGSTSLWQESQRFGVNGRWIPGAPSSLSLAWPGAWLNDTDALLSADGMRITTVRG